ncbi:MAG: VTT domain-containing protein [Candidatus Parcubacteria bacterium]|nr:VTT domain-containing protein [Candidatus Parcubacteria bacterium]
MHDSIKYYLKLFSTPLYLLGLFISLFIVWKIFDLPTLDILLSKIKVWFDIYGYLVLFIGAILEGMLVIGGYFPGTFIIVVSVLLAKSIPELILVVSIGTIGLFVAHNLNYVLGKYGWYRLLIKFGAKNKIEESKEKLLKKGPTAMFSSYWLLSLGALVDTAAGIIHMPFRTFFLYSLLAGIFWNFLVGIIVYNVGTPVLAVVSSGGYTELFTQFSIVLVWILILLGIDIWEKRKKQNT